MIQNPYMNNMPMNYPKYNVPSNGIIWVQGIEGAKAFQLAPASNTMLLDSENDGIFYIKISDQVGMCTLRTFKYTEITETINKPTAPIDLSNYVTRTEFDELLKQLGGLDDGKQSIQSIKPTIKE